MLLRFGVAVTGSVDELVDDVVQPQQVVEGFEALEVVPKMMNEQVLGID